MSMIPEGNESKITKVAVAVDFSEHSADAMDVGIAFASTAGITEIVCLHVYNIPSGYYKTGKSYEQFAEVMKKNAERNYQEFIGQFDLMGLTVTPLFVLHKNTEKGIKETVDKEQIDLVIMATLGRSAGAAIVMGSPMEKLICMTNVPLVAVKKKGAGLSFLEALLKQVKFGE